jgi:hypothetical protein
MLTHKTSSEPSRRHVTACAGLLLVVGLLGGVVVGPSRPAKAEQLSALVIVPSPPAPRFETQPPPPNENAVWDPGHWRWDGRDYAWAPGQYEERPSPEARWRPDGWIEQNGAWVWHPGHWERS